VYNGNTSTFGYGADGLRHRETVNGTVTDYAIDGQDAVRELKAGVSQATYLTGMTGPCYRRDDIAGTVRWYLYDGLGSVLAEVDPNGTVTATRKYDVYGAVRSSTGTSTSKHRFVGSLGHPSEDETGLIYMRARYYDPVTGRFVSEDPEQQTINWFAYGNLSPTTTTDGSGKSPITQQMWQDWMDLWQDFEVGVAPFLPGVRYAAGSLADLLVQGGGDYTTMMKLDMAFEKLALDMANRGAVDAAYMAFKIGYLAALQAARAYIGGYVSSAPALAEMDTITDELTGML
jgi:RHS repeat-associated protein